METALTSATGFDVKPAAWLVHQGNHGLDAGKSCVPIPSPAVPASGTQRRSAVQEAKWCGAFSSWLRTYRPEQQLLTITLGCNGTVVFLMLCCAKPACC